MIINQNKMPRKANTAKKGETPQEKESSSEKNLSTSDKVEKQPSAKSTKTSKSAKSEHTPVDEKSHVTDNTVEKTRSKSAKSAKSSKSVKNNTVDNKEEEPELSDVEDVVDDSSNPKKRHVPSKESIIEGFDELVAAIDEEIERLRESSSKSKGVKFLRSLGKKVKTLRGYSFRVMKQKQKTNRKNNTNSGFLKPVHISNEMAKFTGWSNDDLKSRVDVTKYICKYIRDNNLQNPEDRRQIVADKKLAKLLDFNPEKDDKPLTYYRIQTYMKKHFTNPPGTKVASA